MEQARRAFSLCRACGEKRCGENDEEREGWAGRAVKGRVGRHINEEKVWKQGRRRSNKERGQKYSEERVGWHAKWCGGGR